MKYRKMLGDTIYRLRTEKGISQAELGKLVGVSNKAVSKWETDEANPDISLLPRLAEIFGVTTDELLTDIKVQSATRENAGKSILGFRGAETENDEKYEFVSDKKTAHGLPYLHIHFGKGLSNIGAKAHGVIAIGNNAKGIVSIGLISRGIFSIGLVSIGLFAIGLLSLGLLAFGNFALGGAAIGGIAVGLAAIGGIGVGIIALGGIAVGYAAYGGLSIGVISWDWLSRAAVLLSTIIH